VTADGLEAIGEAANDVEHQRALSDGLAEITQGIHHVLEAPAVVGDRQVALAELAELGVEVEGTGLLVPKELFLKGEPDGAGSGGAGHHGLSEVGGDGARVP
jgi:hypothetical protein